MRQLALELDGSTPMATPVATPERPGVAATYAAPRDRAAYVSPRGDRGRGAGAALPGREQHKASATAAFSDPHFDDE